MNFSIQLSAIIVVAMCAVAFADDDGAVGPIVTPGPFQANWESLEKGYQCPEWFRDAKFGIWAHWTAQCVPEQGDWYARNMYQQGQPSYDHHLKTYGHPSQTGFMEI